MRGDGEGELPSEQGEYLARERYQIATMQLSIAQRIARDPVTACGHKPPPPRQRMIPFPRRPGRRWFYLVLSLPFSSLQLNSSLVQYLELKPEQMSAITRVMANERPYVTPLMADLDAMRQKLARATQNAHPDQKPISSLALTQAQLLTKLVAENADLPS